MFKNRPFARFARSADISDEDLLNAVKAVEDGYIDADLGGGVIKQRVAREGEGKSSGFRTILLYRAGDKTFFVHGFAKADQDNINEKELKGFKKLAKSYQSKSDEELTKLIDDGVLTEIKHVKNPDENG